MDLSVLFGLYLSLSLLTATVILLSSSSVNLPIIFASALSTNNNMSSPSSVAANEMPSLTLSSLSSLTLGGTKLKSIVQDASINKNNESLDLQGIYWMEHINLVVGSNSIASKFYLELLGFTRDEGNSFHVNLGQQQFHLADLTKSKGSNVQTIAGSIGLVVPNLQLVKKRLEEEAQSENNIGYEIICSDDTTGGDNCCFTVRGPYNNIFHLYDINDDNGSSSSKKYKPLETQQKMTNMHSLGGSYGRNRMAIRGNNPGIRYVEIACPYGKSSKIAKFYHEILDCHVVQQEIQQADDNNNRKCAIVTVGNGVHLVFVETTSDNDELLKDSYYKAMEGVHICFYINNFKTIYNRLSSHGLIWTNPRFIHLDTCDTYEEAVASRTLRFKDIIDLDTNEKILELEHETRPLTHGQYLKVPKYIPN